MCKYLVEWQSVVLRLIGLEADIASAQAPASQLPQVAQPPSCLDLVAITNQSRCLPYHSTS